MMKLRITNVLTLAAITFKIVGLLAIIRSAAWFPYDPGVF